MKQEFTTEEKTELRQLCANKPNGHSRMQCPSCSKTRRNKSAQCLSVNVFSDRIVYDCHHCEKAGATFREDKPAFVPPQYERPKPKAVKRLDVAPTEASVEFLTERGLSPRTQQAFNCVSASAYFPDLARQTEGVGFAYIVGETVTGHKVRSLEEKAHVCTNALGSLFGLQNVELAESEDVIITEGEIDAMSFYESGILNATSVPNGASSFSSTTENGDLREQLGFLWTAKDILEKAKRLLIATDQDEKGEKVAEELARRIGKHRCWRVKFPEGCKDANDTLMKHGPDALHAAIANAEPWPISGLYEADSFYEEYDTLFREGFGERINTGLAAVDEVFSVGPGLLTVVTGNPNAGKSNFVNQIVINLARNYGYVTAMCSFETPPPVHLGQISEMLMQKHFFDTREPGEKMTEEEMQSLKPFLSRHVKFMFQDDGEKATVESVIERIKVAVLRWGVKVVVIDPYTYIYRPSDISETAFIDDMLTRIRLTARLYGVHVFFIAHPSKPQVNADGSTPVPKGYSISGSAAWFSKPDHGITVHRVPDSNEVQIHVWKTRFAWLGKNGVANVYFDTMRHVYISDNFGSLLPYQSDQSREYYN